MLLVVAAIAGPRRPADITAPSSTPPATTTAAATPAVTGTMAPPAITPPRATATPQGAMAGDFADIELTGRGDSVERFNIPEEAVAIAVIDFQGDGFFGLKGLAADGSTTDLLASAIGQYQGTVLFDDREHSVALEVTANGPWTITIRHLSQADRWDPATTLAGGGDTVVIVDPPISGLYTANVQHIGDGFFGLVAHGDGISPLVAEIDDYEGEIAIPAGTIVLEITSSSKTFWTVEPSE